MKKSWRKIWKIRKYPLPLHSQNKTRAFSSAGLEHLPYKQRVGGSNPSTPTKFYEAQEIKSRAFSSAGLEHLPYKQRVGGSNPSTPTKQRMSFNRLYGWKIFFALLFTSSLW